MELVLTSNILLKVFLSCGVPVPRCTYFIEGVGIARDETTTPSDVHNTQQWPGWAGSMMELHTLMSVSAWQVSL